MRPHIRSRLSLTGCGIASALCIWSVKALCSSSDSNSWWIGVVVAVAVAIGSRLLSDAPSSSAKDIPSLDRIDAAIFATVVVAAGVVSLLGVDTLVLEGSAGWETPHNNLYASSYRTVVDYSLLEPGISQGYLWFLLHYVAQCIMGISPTAGRIALGLNYALTAGLLYVATRLVTNRSGSLLAVSIFLGSALEFGLARSDYGLQLPVPFTLLTLIATITYFRDRRWFTRALLIASMALTNLLYCSAILFAFFPVIFFLLHAHTFTTPRSRVDVTATLTLGLLAWLFVPSLIASGELGEFRFISPLQAHASDKAIFYDRDSENRSIFHDFAKAAGHAIGNTTEALKLPFRLVDDGYLFITSENELYFVPLLCLVGLVTMAGTKGLGNRLLFASLTAWLMCGAGPGILSHDFATRRFLVLTPILYMCSATALNALMMRYVTSSSMRAAVTGGLVLMSVVGIHDHFQYLLDRGSVPEQTLASYMETACDRADLCLFHYPDQTRAFLTAHYLLEKERRYMDGKKLLVLWPNELSESKSVDQVIGDPTTIREQPLYTRSALHEVMADHAWTGGEHVVAVTFTEGEGDPAYAQISKLHWQHRHKVAGSELPPLTLELFTGSLRNIIPGDR